MSKFKVSFLLLLFSELVFSQYNPDLNKYLNPASSSVISKATKDTIAFRQFARIVTGEPAAANYVSYASFNPSDPAFSASAFISSRKCRTVNGNLSVKGSLLDDKLSALFMNTGTINTNTSGNLKLNIRTDKPTLNVDHRDVYALNEKIENLKQKLNYDTLKIIYNLKMTDNYISQNQNKLRFLKDSLKRLNNNLNKVIERSKVVNCDTNEICRGTKNDTIISINSKIEAIGLDTVKIRTILDSLLLSKEFSKMNGEKYHGITQQKDTTYVLFLLNKYKNKFKKDTFQLKKNIPSSIINICWFSIGAGIADHSFKAYNSTLNFSDQIFDRNLMSTNYNLDFNFFHKDSLARSRYFINIGSQYKVTNNVADLTSFIINQSTPNANNNITRTIKKDYTVYQDTLVEEYTSISAYAHFYYTFDKFQKNTLHLNTIAENRSDNKQVYTLLLGYIYAFTKPKAEREILNIELYFKCNDLSQQIDPTSTFKTNLQMGISFTIPFNLNIN
jgi:hypothetical protein